VIRVKQLLDIPVEVLNGRVGPSIFDSDEMYAGEVIVLI
jgi:hypothetical protein